MSRKTALMSVPLYLLLAYSVFAIDGSGTANYVPKFLDSDTLTDSSIYVSSSGNVGIGTTNPAYRFHIYGTAPYVRLEGTASTGIELFDGGLSIGGVSTGNDDLTLFSRTGHDIRFNDGSGTTKMFIKDGGKVGIGTISPSSLLHVIQSSADDNDTGLIVETTNSAERARITLKQGGLSDVGMMSFNFTGLHLSATSGFQDLNIDTSGNVGIGTTSPSEKLTVRGNIRVENASGTTVAEIGEGLDYAEGFDVSQDEEIEPGTVLVIDEMNPGELTVSSRAYDSKVAGIAAGAKGLGSGVRLGVGQFDCDVALAGRVYCNVDATVHAIRAGDLLTTSDMAGYAMKAVDKSQSHGAILGKAMQSLAKGEKGQILVLVTLQ